MATLEQRDALTAELDLLACWFAERYARRGLEYDDGRQEALTAIWVASGRYDPMRSDCHVPFSAFARKFIIRALERVLAKARSAGLVAAPTGVRRAAVELDGIAGVGTQGGRNSIADAVRDALDRCDLLSQTLVVRRYGLDGLSPWSIIECANEFDLTVRSVKKLLARARSIIAAELQAAGWDPARWHRRVAVETSIKAG